MNEAEAKSLGKKLSESFPDGDATWYEEYKLGLLDFLLAQDYVMARKAIYYFAEDANREKMPPIGFIKGKIQEFQQLRSAEEAGKQDVSACQTCKGATWTHDPTGLIPCPQCRPETHNRWATSAYAMDAPLNEAELDGPDGSYPQASRPRINTGVAVSLERAVQWRDHLLSGNYLKHDYPEEAHNG